MSSVPFPGPWAERGACREEPADLFFIDVGGTAGRAREICGGCEVRNDCAEYALRYPAIRGFWGGLSDQERKKERSRRRVDALRLVG